MFVTAKKILKDAGFNHRKFYSSSEAMQARVSLLEQPQETLQESYTSSTVGGEQKLCLGEQVLGNMSVGTCRTCWWNMSVEQLLIGFEEIASAARALTLMKRSIVSLAG